MPIEIKCSACGKAYVVKDEFAGKTAECTQCGGRIQIPGRARYQRQPAEVERSPASVSPPSIGPIGPPSVAATPPPMPNQPPQVGTMPQTSFLLQPRGYIETAWMISMPLGCILGTVFCVLGLLAKRSGNLSASLEFPQIVVYCLGLGFAVSAIGGLTAAPLHVGVVRVLRVSDREGFLSCLKIATAQMRYKPETQTASFLTFQGPLGVFRLVGPISVQLEPNRVTIVGPKMCVAELLKLLKRLNAPCGA